MRTKPSLLWHRWFGVLGGLWLFVIALTGCFLVFYSELDQAFNPDLFEARWGDVFDGQSIAPSVEAAEAAFPGSTATFIEMPSYKGATLTIYLEDRADSQGAVGDDGLQVFVDPATSEVQGSRVWGALEMRRAQIMPFIYKLHYELHGGAWIYWLLGVLALLWLTDHFVSVLLALRSAKKWGDTFKLRRRAKGHKRVFDLHRAGGMWLLPVTAMLAFTGVYFNLYDEFMAVLEPISAPTVTLSEKQPVLDSPLYSAAIDADEALAAARRYQPDIQVSGLGYDAGKGLWTIRAHDHRDLIAESGALLLTVDARSGRLLGREHWSEGSVGDTIVAWQYPLHSGKVFGWTGRILVLLAGIVTCLLTLTGYLVWWRKRSARTVNRAPKTQTRSVPAPGLEPAE